MTLSADGNKKSPGYGVDLVFQIASIPRLLPAVNDDDADKNVCDDVCTTHDMCGDAYNTPVAEAQQSQPSVLAHSTP
jgi:hypothetical protein